jgi:ubiquinone biosynthesis monooxygenase Coq7
MVRAVVAPCRLQSTSTNRNDHQPSTSSSLQEHQHHQQEEKLRRHIYDRIIRVNQAGELGAQQIYAGQLYVLKGTPDEPILQDMAKHEAAHLKKFDELMRRYQVRPTVLTPLWRVAGFALGMGTALMGREAAMACTVAVETTVGDHYNDQLRTLEAHRMDSPQDQELRQTIRQFRDEELEHLDIGLKNDAEKAPLYGLLTHGIRMGSTLAIWLSTRI